MAFANSSNFTIHDSTFTDVSGNINNYIDRPGERGIRELFKVSSSNAGYDSQGYAYRDDSEVYQFVIQEVEDWVKNGSTKICWIYGAPDSGKSTLMQEISKRFAQSGTLGASFFFHKVFRQSYTALATSIASQLVVAIPEKRVRLGEMIEADISILQKPLAVQIEKLVVVPFLPHTGQSGEIPQPRLTTPPVVVIIDAINECFGYPCQRELIDILHWASSNAQLPILWIVTSRPEATIRRSFDSIAAHVHSISLADVGLLVEKQHQVTLSVYFLNRYRKLYEKYPITTMCLQAIFAFVFFVFSVNVVLVFFFKTLGLLFHLFLRRR